jgi:hypothetical protein
VGDDLLTQVIDRRMAEEVTTFVEALGLIPSKGKHCAGDRAAILCEDYAVRVGNTVTYLDLVKPRFFAEHSRTKSHGSFPEFVGRCRTVRAAIEYAENDESINREVGAVARSLFERRYRRELSGFLGMPIELPMELGGLSAPGASLEKMMELYPAVMRGIELYLQLEPKEFWKRWLRCTTCVEHGEPLENWDLWQVTLETSVTDVYHGPQALPPGTDVHSFIEPIRASGQSILTSTLRTMVGTAIPTELTFREKRRRESVLMGAVGYTTIPSALERISRSKAFEQMMEPFRSYDRTAISMASLRRQMNRCRRMLESLDDGVKPSRVFKDDRELLICLNRQKETLSIPLEVVDGLTAINLHVPAII